MTTGRFRITPVGAVLGLAVVAMLAFYLTAPKDAQETAAGANNGGTAAPSDGLQAGEWTGTWRDVPGKRSAPGAPKGSFPITVSANGHAITLTSNGQAHEATDARVSDGRLTFTVPDEMSCALTRQTDGSYDGTCSETGGNGSMGLKMLPSAMASAATSPAERGAAAVNDLRLALDGLSTAQEDYRADKGSYASSVARLTLYERIPGVEVTITQGTATGWAATATKAGATCVIFNGVVQTAPRTPKGVEPAGPNGAACD